MHVPSVHPSRASGRTEGTPRRVGELRDSWWDSATGGGNFTTDGGGRTPRRAGGSKANGGNFTTDGEVGESATVGESPRRTGGGGLRNERAEGSAAMQRERCLSSKSGAPSLMKSRSFTSGCKLEAEPGPDRAQPGEPHLGRRVTYRRGFQAKGQPQPGRSASTDHPMKQARI